MEWTIERLKELKIKNEKLKMELEFLRIPGKY